MGPIDPVHHAHVRPVQMPGEIPPVSSQPAQQPSAIQTPATDPTIQQIGGGGHGKGGHGHVAQQATAAVTGHQKSWKSHFMFLQNPATTVIKKHVKAEMKRISKEEKKIQKRDKEEKQKDKRQNPFEKDELESSGEKPEQTNP